MKRSGSKRKITERGRAILAGTGPKIALHIEDGQLPPLVLRPRKPAATIGLLAQAFAMNGPEPTKRAIAALMKTPGRKQQAIADSANGAECSVRIPRVCLGTTDTTVWSHFPGIDGGRGMGLKSLDLCGAYCCFACHEVVDMRVPAPVGYSRLQVIVDWSMGHLRSLVILRQKGLA